MKAYKYQKPQVKDGQPEARGVWVPVWVFPMVAANYALIANGVVVANANGGANLNVAGNVNVGYNVNVSP